jgi:CRISPR-associated protein Csb2
MTADDLAIGVTFLQGRYHGVEWPPSPARLYQAMVAGVMTGGYRALFPEVEPALRWLEQQEPPTILVSGLCRRPTAYRIAIPNNDLDRAGMEWAMGREANPAQYRTLKTISARAVNGDGPHVVYRWRAHPEQIRTWADLLRRVIHCLHTFGWGIDMAFAELVSGEERALDDRYSPRNNGSMHLNIPIGGTLDDLHATYKRFLIRTTGKGVDAHTHPSMIDTRRYGAEGERNSPVARFGLLDASGEQTKSVPWAHCMKVAGWLRHEAARVLRERGWPEHKIASYIQGHTGDDDKSRRLSYIPLPSIAGRYPDGRIRRVILVEPAAEPGDAVTILQRAMSGRSLTDDNGAPTACLSAAANTGDATFKHYIDVDGSHTWRSVTPVVLHGFNVQRRGVIDVNKTEKLLIRAFEMAGHPEGGIERLAFQAGPLWRGTGHAVAILVPQHLAKYPRVHVEVTFRSATKGPVLAGIGRHYGIGVFASRTVPFQDRPMS